MKRMRLSSTLVLSFLLLMTYSPVLPLVMGDTDVYDLEVSLTAHMIRDTYNHLSSGDSTVLNVTVTNKGDFNESDVALQLLINGAKVLDATTPRLEINRTFWTAYFWTPDDADYNLTAYAPPVNGEDNETNNVCTRWVWVCQDQPPIANFTYSPPPPPPGPIMNEDVTFNASGSYDPDWGTIMNYTWDFDDGNFGVGVTVNHTYRTWGNKTVTLKLRDTENLTSSTSRNITVYACPIAKFTILPPPSKRYVDYPLTFNATDSYDPDGYIVNYTWNFGDGKTTIIGDDEPVTAIINHTYTTVDTYKVTLTLTDNDTLTNSTFKWITIGSGIPIADFEITPGPPYYVNQTLTFDASNSTPDGGTIISYYWIWNDGTTNVTSAPDINHTFTAPKIYNVTLTVIDEKGLEDNETEPVNVIWPVYMKVEPKQVESDPEQTFTVNITIAHVEDLKSFEFKLFWPADWLPPKYYLLKYHNVSEGNFLGPQRYPNGTQRWECEVTFGDGYVSVNCSFTPVVSKEERSGDGTLVTITFLVKSSGNATLNLDETILLDSLGNPIDHSVEDGYFYTTTPVANFTWSKPAVPHENVTFDASSSYDPDNYTAPNHGIANYTWNFDDGTTPVTTSNPTINHTFTDFGTYNVNLTVTDYNKTTWWIPYPVLVGSRDVAIIAVEPSSFAFNETLVGYENNGDLPINVTVKNNGDFPENFNVTVYADNEELGTQNVTELEPGESKNLTFHLYAFNWSATHGLPKGDYSIKANVTLVEPDMNPGNDQGEGGVVRVYLAGDVNRDNTTNMRDIGDVCYAFDSHPSDEKWDPNADLNCDGVINMRDIGIACDNFGKTDP